MQEFKLPSVLTPRNISGFIRSGTASTKYVFHMPTRTFAVGHEDDSHKNIAMAALNITDIPAERKSDYAAGMLLMPYSGTMGVAEGSGFFGKTDVLPVENCLGNILRQDGYRVEVDNSSGTTRLDFPPASELPCLLGAGNQPLFFNASAKNPIEVSFVFHQPTGILGIGDMKAGHEAIGRALFSPFEIDAADKDNILGGVLAIRPWSDSAYVRTFNFRLCTGFYPKIADISDLLARFINSAEQSGYQLASRSICPKNAFAYIWRVH